MPPRRKLRLPPPMRKPASKRRGQLPTEEEPLPKNIPAWPHQPAVQHLSQEGTSVHISGEHGMAKVGSTLVGGRGPQPTKEKSPTEQCVLTEALDVPSPIFPVKNSSFPSLDCGNWPPALSHSPVASSTSMKKVAVTLRKQCQ